MIRRRIHHPVVIIVTIMVVPLVDHLVDMILIRSVPISQECKCLSCRSSVVVLSMSRFGSFCSLKKKNALPRMLSNTYHGISHIFPPLLI